MLYEVRLDRPVRFEDLDDLTFHAPDLDAATVYARDALTEDRFTALDATLGPEHTPGATTFRVWSPVSDSVDVLLYDRLDAPRPSRTVAMEHAGRGVWAATVDGDLHGAAYQIRFRSYGEDRVVPDIHCLAATYDSRRSVVVDLDRTDPEGWGETPLPFLARPTDEVIYEVHVRDFSIANEGVPARKRGTYLGMVESPTLDTPGGPVRTGLDHLLELGVTGVHLLPIQDFTAGIGEYNWGYWTTLFNVAESNYSTNPREPLLAITELKEMIRAMHGAGLRVILDVVYNHTSSSGRFSAFDQSVPYYYFRTTLDGSLRNDAGVGNSMADERPMVRKYISDSLAYWTEEYRIDGYRFDLLGTHRPESVESWVQRLRSIRDDLTIYGEPWTGGGPTYFPKGAQRGLGLAVFNDHLRNAIRGDLDGDAIGFATGPGGDEASIARGVAGAITDFAHAPTETINYASAHDNLTMWDKILRVTPGATDAQRRAMQKLAHGVVLTSQGIAFIHGGAPFARTKGGNHNSYNAGDSVNAYDWDRKAEYRDVFDYVAGLVELRRARPAFRIADRRLVREAVRGPAATNDPGDGLLGFTIRGDVVGDDWGLIRVVYNGSPDERSVDLGAGTWNLVVDHERAGTETIRRVGGTHTMPPYSMIVVHR